METFVAILVWLLFGLIIGALARLIVPGRQHMGWLTTIGLGILGSFLGGLVAYLFRGGEPLQTSGFWMSLLGAVIVLAIGLSVGNRERRPH